MTDQKKRILVFGGAGFIGTYLIDELRKQGYETVASDISALGESYCKQQGIPYIPVDITKPDEFNKLKGQLFHTVINLAALQPANFNSAYQPKDYININVNGTLNILEYCRQNNVKKIIYGSSHRNTSGLWKLNRPIKEEDGRGLEYKGEYSMFGISESSAQDCVEYYRSNYDMQGIIFRLPPVYGYGPHLDIFKDGKPIKTGFQTFIENARQGKPLEMWGNSGVGRDIIYVKDVVSAFLKAIENEKAGGLYNITSGYRLTLKEEVETIARVFGNIKNGAPVIVERPDKPHKMDSFVYDNGKAKRELDWAPQYNFEALLYDYKEESENNKFGFLVEKRNKMFSEKQ
jgi:UDP-glucose 4-epimerase